MTGENGSTLGEAIRRFVNEQSNGVFGNGNMQRKPGESSEDYQNRLLYALGYASSAYNSAVKNGNPMEGLKIGVIVEKIKGVAPVALLVVGGIAAIKYFKNRKKKGSKKLYK
ncbi:hypothetical protein D3C71_50670 [compost metagenome]